MRTTSCVVGDNFFAVRAFLGVGSGSGFGSLGHQPIDLLDQNEDRRRHDQKVQTRVEKHAVGYDRRARLFRRRNRFILDARQIDIEIGKIDLAEQKSQRRHDDVGGKRRNDFAERRADDDARCHVDNVAPHYELTEFFPQNETLSFRLSLKKNACT